MEGRRSSPQQGYRLVPDWGKICQGSGYGGFVLCTAHDATSVSLQVLLSLCDLIVAKDCFHICLAGYSRLLNEEGKPDMILVTLVFQTRKLDSGHGSCL